MTKAEPSIYDPNFESKAEHDNLNAGGAVFPVIDNAFTVDQYAMFFTEIQEPRNAWAERLVMNKALSLPPEMQAFTKLSTIPSGRAGNVIQWPGLPPEALRKIVRENLAPQMIINLRVSDVLRYAELSTHPWKPGWQIGLQDSKATPSDSDLQDIRDAERFILNCNAETGWNARERDKARLSGFANFSAALTRDSLTYDGMSIWTDMDHSGRVKGFKALSTFNIRLVGPMGYNGDKSIFATAVDDAGNIVSEFTRDELVFYTRNPRADPDIWGYGYPEIEMAVRLIQGFQNSLDMNVDTFQRNSIPNGFLTVSGRWTQRQLDVLSRIWLNLKRGVTKSWSIPVIALPEKGEIKVNDLTDIKGKEVYYQDFMNMMMGAFAAIYCFPTTRLGYRISGAGPDSHSRDQQTASTIVDDDDPGLMPLLHHIECVINEYLLWSRWPHLRFWYNGKNPKEDAREYEARTNAMTLGEHRAMTDLPDLTTFGKDEEEKRMLRLMASCPYNPAMAGVFQSIIAAATSERTAKMAQDAKVPQPGAPFPGKKDPASSEDHGHASGVRRDSAAEGAK